MEIGFGRGFNTATLLREAQATWLRRGIEVTAFEPFPQHLQPWPHCPTDLQAFLPWWGQLPAQGHAEWQDLEAAWSVQVHAAEAQESLAWERLEDIDLFLLDLFSPGRHPDAWRAPLFERIAAARASNSVLTTYTCARSVRDALTRTGWSVRRLRSEGRRDTLVAHFDATPAPGNG